MYLIVLCKGACDKWADYHWCHMPSWIRVNIGLGNGLLLANAKPLPETVMGTFTGNCQDNHADVFENHTIK